MRRQVKYAVAAIVLASGVPTMSWGQETQDIRPYMALRTSLGPGGAIFAEPESVSGVELESPSGEPIAGATLGVDWGRHWGLELATENVETTIENSGTGEKISEYSIWTVLVQLRLRYPLLQDRLVPYALVGGGLGISEANDSNIGNVSTPLSGEIDRSLAGVAGLGSEYFVARNIAVGLETKYRFGMETEIDVAGRRGDLNLDSLTWSAGLRIYLDEAAPDQVPARDSDALRGYLSLRAGGAAFTGNNDRIGVELSNPAFPNGGASVGMNLYKFLGLELSVDSVETEVDAPGVGTLGEYTIVAAAAQARLRYPILEDRLVPYLVAGGGVGFGEFNDRKVPQSQFAFDGDQSYSPLATIGAGAEYFLADNVAVGFEAKQLLLFDGDVEVGGQPKTIDLDAFFLTAGIRIFFP